MGQTLPHGIYLPDNGERNCYTGLSQNWQKLDNLLGNKGDKVSFAQTLTEGVEIGKITINGVDVSLYHTDYSDKADADNVYTKAEADTLLSAKANASDLTAHTSDTNIHVTSADKNKWNAKQDALSNQQLSNIADVTNKANDSDVVHKSGGTMTGDLLGNGSNNLGTSTNKWKTINGINPGALSLPNIANGINIDTTNWNLTGVANTFTPASDGYIYLRVEHTSTPPKIVWYINSYNAYSDNRTISTPGALSSGFIPVIANTPISILITATSIRSAKFYPCIGNV